MSDLKPLDIIRQLPGSWRLPIRSDESITVSFSPNGKFFWNISAYSTTKKTIQIFTGPDYQGNWHIRSERSKGSSASSLSSVSSSFSLIKSQPPKSSSDITGPFLVLNFTDLPHSILNITPFGVRMDVANWINNFFEIARNNDYRILEFTTDEMHLEAPNNTKEVWRRVSK